VSKSKCVLARIDIVAFGLLSKSSSEANVVFDEVEAIFSEVNENVRRLNESSKKDLKIETPKLYGDTIDTYFRCGNYDGVLMIMLLDSVAKAQRTALDRGFFIKGAIVKDDLYIADAAFTGRAMVTASNLERNCPYSSVTISKDIIDLIDETAKERFRNDQDIADFKENVIVDGCFINYLEASPYDFWKDIRPDLKSHRKSLVSTIARYEDITEHGSAESEKYMTICKKALENHNRVCKKHGAQEEVIEFRAECTGGVGKLTIDD